MGGQWVGGAARGERNVQIEKRNRNKHTISRKAGATKVVRYSRPFFLLGCMVSMRCGSVRLSVAWWEKVARRRVLLLIVARALFLAASQRRIKLSHSNYKKPRSPPHTH